MQLSGEDRQGVHSPEGEVLTGLEERQGGPVWLKWSDGAGRGRRCGLRDVAGVEIMWVTVKDCFHPECNGSPWRGACGVKLSITQSDCDFMVLPLPN